MNIAPYIDHTLLKPTCTSAAIEQVCAEAREFEFAAVCVPPPFVQLAYSLLESTAVKVATVIGFPFGYSIAQAKLEEAKQAIQDGADELDVVINLTAVKAGQWEYLEYEMNMLVDLVHAKGRLIKVIIESGILSDAEIIRCCELYSKLKVDFLKTSTGYADKGASVEAVKLMRAHLPEQIKIKASGGIRDYAFAKELVEAGADRLGCSASVAIVQGGTGTGNY